MKVIVALWVYAAIAVGLLLTTGCMPKSGGKFFVGYETTDSIERVEKTEKTKRLSCYIWENCDKEGDDDGK